MSSFELLISARSLIDKNKDNGFEELTLQQALDVVAKHEAITNNKRLLSTLEKFLDIAEYNMHKASNINHSEA